MNEDYKLLVERFKKISNKGYIKSSAKGLGSIGLTFEHELGKQNDSMYFPDFYGIEIKCSSRYSKYPIGLFTCAFDGPTFPEINRIIEKYGYYDSYFKDKKILNATLNCKTKVLVNNKYKFILDVDETEEKIYLCVYDLLDNLIERESFIYFVSLENHLNLKLKTMALVRASIKRTIDTEYFRYYKMAIYELISFKAFIDLLKDGTIKVSLCSRIARSGNDFGKYKNKNLGFNIYKDKLDKLFKKIYVIDNDKKQKYNTNFQILNGVKIAKKIK